MTRSILLATVSLAMALAFGMASAQTPPPAGQQAPPRAPGAPAAPGQAQAPGQGAPSQGAPGYGNPSQDAEGVPWPVAFVISVELLRSRDGRDIVQARGLVTSKGWSKPRLIPINSGPPIDGVLDLLFEATAPAAPLPAPLGDFMEVDALLPISHNHPYKAIRVRSATKSLTLKQLPGYVEVRKLKNDCANCIGKYFVAKGGTPPAGIPADNIVKEEDLLWEVRAIKPGEGIANYTLNPNRLTLVLTEDGRISDAGWD
jgi:hypothetical protein